MYNATIEVKKSLFNPLNFFKAPELTDQQIEDQLGVIRDFPITASLLPDTLDQGWTLIPESRASMAGSSGLKSALAFTDNKNRSFHLSRDTTQGEFMRLAAHEFTHGQQQQINPVSLSKLNLVDHLVTHRFREAHADVMEGMITYHHWRTEGDKTPWEQFKKGRPDQAKSIGLTLFEAKDELAKPDFWHPDNPVIIKAAINGFKTYFTSGHVTGHDYILAGMYEHMLEKQGNEQKIAPRTDQNYDLLLASLKLGDKPLLGNNWEKIQSDMLIWPMDSALSNRICKIEKRFPGTGGFDSIVARKMIHDTELSSPTPQISTKPRI